jgi:hypothetical protein
VVVDEARVLHRQVVRWWTGDGSAVDVALAADACLDAGFDGPALAALASMAEGPGPALLAAALREAGATPHRPGTSGSVPPAAAELQRRAECWRTRRGTAFDVVLAACDCLAAGLDGAGLVELASLTSTEAEDALAGVLPAALRDAGLSDRPPGDPLDLVADGCVRLLAGEIGARDLTGWAHEVFTHHSAPPLVGEFLELDDIRGAGGGSVGWARDVTVQADLFLLLVGAARLSWRPTSERFDPPPWSGGPRP